MGRVAGRVCVGVSEFGAVGGRRKARRGLTVPRRPLHTDRPRARKSPTQAAFRWSNTLTLPGTLAALRFRV
jgi:hypothetical protein